jgi:hypothetical protein
VLQVALTAFGIWGLIELGRNNRLPSTAVVALVMAPMVRYENLPVTALSCGYLILAGKWRPAVLIIAITVSCLAIFSAVLVTHGLSALPTSIMAKSGAVGLGFAGALATNFVANLQEPQAWILLGLTLPLGMRLVRPGVPFHRQLAAFAIIAVGAHLVFGKFGWRYEHYIFCIELLVLFEVYGEEIRWLVCNTRGNSSQWLRPLALLAATVVLFFQYSLNLLKIPLACNDIYLQQMQMARFVGEYWKRAVAVNDLGAVALASDHYILDYGGLASMEVLKVKLPDPLWMDKLAKEHKVELAILHASLYPDIPTTWRVVGRLHLNVALITPPENVLTFYAITPAPVLELKRLLTQFSSTLPVGASLDVL